MLLIAVVVMTFGGRLVFILAFVGVVAEFIVNLLVPAAIGIEVLRVRRTLA
jgi:hypothetical protein